MLDEQRIKEATTNMKHYLTDYSIRKMHALKIRFKLYEQTLDNEKFINYINTLI